MRVAFYTLGCKLNFSESATIAREFKDAGHVQVKQGDIADLYVINTCTVTQQAEKKSRQIIKKARKLNPDAQIVVVGCYAEVRADEVSQLAGVDLVTGEKNMNGILNGLYYQADEALSNDHLKTFQPAFSVDERTRSFLKIQDGCDYWCAYCTIPRARGKSRNASIKDVVENARLIAGKGVKEVVLTGVNIGDFGKSTNESFIELLHALDQVKGIERYRISSVEPNLLTDEIIRFVADSAKFAPHFHIPLQGGSDEILEKMGRRYNTALFAERINQINDVFEGASIGIDVIVGFPGETDELFQETYRFLADLEFSYLHVFNYSKRPGTRAEQMSGHLPPPVREQRSKDLIELSNQKKINFYKKHIGKTQSVIFEDRLSDGYMFGFTGNYINVRAPYDQQKVNVLSPVKLSEPDADFNWLTSTLP